MARPERFELPTYSSGGCRSIQLSYGRVIQVYICRLGPSICAPRIGAMEEIRNGEMPEMDRAERAAAVVIQIASKGKSGHGAELICVRRPRGRRRSRALLSGGPHSH